MATIDDATMRALRTIIQQELSSATSVQAAAQAIAKGVTQYIGARYVPLFAEPLQWDSTKEYEPLTIVLYQGNSYTTRQYTPAGIDIANEAFWAETGNYNAQIEQYRQEVKEVKQAIADEKSERMEDTETLTAKVDVWFDTVADMKAATNLANGMTVHTNGFHSVNDGGAAFYRISDTGEANEMDVIGCKSNLCASIILCNELYPEQIGAYGDGEHDDSTVLQQAINVSYSNKVNITLKARAHYLVKNTININRNYLKIGSNSYAEYTPVILGDGEVSPIFNVTGQGCTFENFIVQSSSSNTRVNVGIIFDFDSEDKNGDCDAILNGFHVSYFITGIIVKGRNLTVKNSGFTACNVGISLSDLTNISGELRGYVFINNRFHVVFTCIDNTIKNISSNQQLLILNNYIDGQSNSLYTGGAGGVQIANNYCCDPYNETGACVIFTASSNSANPNIVSNNLFNGFNATNKIRLRAAIEIMTQCKGGLYHISNNIISGYADAPIHIAGSETITNISNNTIYPVDSNNAVNVETRTNRGCMFGNLAVSQVSNPFVYPGSNYDVANNSVKYYA